MQINRSVLCIDGTRHRVIEIAADHVAYDYSAEQIVEQYPDPTLAHWRIGALAQAHAALTYYFDHQEKVDAALIASYKHTDRLRKAQKLRLRIFRGQQKKWHLQQVCLLDQPLAFHDTFVNRSNQCL